MRPVTFLLPILAMLAACGSNDDGELDIAFIADEASLFADDLRLSAGAQHLRGATASGLVALDARGDVVPALAERWRTFDDGRSFIFRLREGSWPDGSDLTSESVRTALRRNLRALRGTSLGLDLSPIEEVRAMAGRVIEIRLSTPVPDLLLLLAQPEMAFAADAGATGPMVLERDGAMANLQFKPPLERGLPESEDWQDEVRPVALRAMPIDEALASFNAGDSAIVLGGTLGNWPLVDVGPLSRGTVRVDPAIGLFGLYVRSDRGILADVGVREALAMAIDRQALFSQYAVSGWIPTTRLVAPGLPGDAGFVTERWLDQSFEARQGEARRRIARQIVSRGAESREEGAAAGARLTVSMAAGPGYDMLLEGLNAQLSAVGVKLLRAENEREVDLVLIDRTARYSDPRWFLNQFHCSLRKGLCDDDADYLVELAKSEPDPQIRASLIAEAEVNLTRANIFIPLGAPLRWSLVRGTVENFQPNSWAFHPLPPLAQIPR